MPTNFKRSELISASEVARYIYCKRAWSYDHRVRLQRHWLWKIMPRPWVFLLVGVVVAPVLGWLWL